MLANARGRAGQPQNRAVAVSERVCFGGRATASALMISKPAATEVPEPAWISFAGCDGGVAVNGL